MKVSAAAVAGFAAMLCCLFAATAAEAQNVVTYHNTPNRHGVFTMPGLTDAAAARIHVGFTTQVSGNVYAQPLYWQAPGAKTGLLIVATESNIIYALNANTGARVWQTKLGSPVPRGMFPCGNIDPVEGVTGAPVIDPAAGSESGRIGNLNPQSALRKK